MPLEDITRLRVSTDALPMRERLPYWREVVGRQIVHVDIDPWSDVPFEAEATLRVVRLASPSHAGWIVSAIALASDFGDPSHFNRSFRGRYGATPSDVRAATQSRGDT